MHRIIVPLLAATILVLAGCNKNQQPAATTPADPGPSAGTSLDRMDSAGAAPGNTYDPAADYNAAANQRPADGGYSQRGGNDGEVLQPTGAGGGRAHTVARGDTLYSLARQYYGNASRWKDIYNANRGVISDKDKLRVGMQLVIP